MIEESRGCPQLVIRILSNHHEGINEQLVIINALMKAVSIDFSLLKVENCTKNYISVMQYMCTLAQDTLITETMLLNDSCSCEYESIYVYTQRQGIYLPSRKFSRGSFFFRFFNSATEKV